MEKNIIRKNYIDYLKGIGIFLVVVGHTGNNLSGWIYSFHMGLFFWISGYLVAGKPPIPTKNYLTKKLKSIILPFVGFWFLSVIIQAWRCHKAGIELDYFECIKGLLLGGHYLEITGNFPLWFLQLFFIAEIIFFIEVKYFPKIIKIITNIVLLLGTLWFQQILPGRPPFHINVLPCALVYMAIGYACYFLLDGRIINNSVGILLLIAGWNLHLQYNGNVSQINSYWYYFESICSIVGLYILSKNIKVEANILSRTGKISLYIMGFHSLLVNYAVNFVQYINNLCLFENEFVLHMLLAIVLFSFSYIISDIYVMFKSTIVYRNKQRYIVARGCKT